MFPLCPSVLDTADGNVKKKKKKRSRRRREDSTGLTGGPPTLRVVLPRTHVFREALQLLGVEVHPFRQQEEELAGLGGDRVALHLLPLQEVIQQLGRLRRTVRRVLGRALFGASATVLCRHKVHGLVFGHVAVDCRGRNVNGEVSGGRGG